MTIPFLHLFKRKAIKEHSVVASVAPLSVEKAINERLGKTVLPNAVLTVGQGESSGPRIPFSVKPGGQSLAVALALEPAVERAISLDLEDVVAQLPAGLIRPWQDGDANRRVSLKASEIEKGMASAKPAASLFTIYEQVPEIFLNPVAASDTRQVPLPFTKVLEQFSNLQQRVDQDREQSVPQVETPFLQVTLEDNTRFGIATAPTKTENLPPVRVDPPTVKDKFSLGPHPALAPADPRLPEPRLPEITALAPASGAPARIAFKLTPNGTDVPAPERVPASSGPSVPTSLPASPAPTRIPFNVGASSGEDGKKKEPWLTKEILASDEVTIPAAETPAPDLHTSESVAGVSDCKIFLPLKPILQSLPPFQLIGDIAGVSDDARLELPFSLVESQLSTGRVTLLPKDFAAALPDEHRGLFGAENLEALVALPLQDVLKNLPATSLRIREDQETEERENDFATPFSAKAEEDAKRLGAPLSAPLVKPAVAKRAAGAGDPADATEPLAPVAVAPVRTPLQELLETDDDLDAKAVASYVGRMTGVMACAIMFNDGLSLAGVFPPEYQADGLCALAPSLLQRVESHLPEAKLGALHAMTVSCARAAVTFLMKGNLCLAALHQDELTADVRARLTLILDELSLKYSQPV